MNKKSPSFFSFLLLIFCNILLHGNLYAQNKELEEGLYEVKNYNSKETKGISQNWAFAQDKRGIIYIGNNAGLLEYDGTRWQRFDVDNQAAVKSLAIAKDGKIFVGGVTTFGYFLPNEKGKYVFNSLMPYLKTEGDSAFTDVWRTLINKKGEVFFQTSGKVFKWNGKEIKVFTAQNSFHTSYLLDDNFYVLARGEGIKKMVNDSLKLLTGTEIFANENIYSMINFNGRKIILTKHLGLFEFKESKVITSLSKFKTEADNLLENTIVQNCIMLSDEILSIGTSGSGLILINSKGELKQIISKATGLQDETVLNQFIDSQHNLWLALNNGVTRININSPISQFNEKNGLGGTVQAVKRFNGSIYAATNLGVFYLKIDKAKQQKSFIRLPIISSESWDLCNVKIGQEEFLFVASNAAVYAIDKNNSVQLIFVHDISSLLQSVFFPNRVYVGLLDGFAILEYKSGKWQNIHTEEMPNDDVRTIYEETKDRLWYGTNGNGVGIISLSQEGEAIKKINILKSSGRTQKITETASIFKLDNKTVFATTHGFRKFIFENSAEKNINKLNDVDQLGRFVECEGFTERFADTTVSIHRVFVDEKNLWAVTYDTKDVIDIGYFEKDQGKRNWIDRPFKPISKEIIHNIFVENYGIAWLGGPEGIYRYDRTINKNYEREYSALIREVNIQGDSLIFNGTYLNPSDSLVVFEQPDELKVKFAFKYNWLAFKFAAPYFDSEADITYSYYLEGNDKGWSNWASKTDKDYTNLHEGKYKFHVKAKNIYGVESKESVYEFTILPPWYRTIWAYIFYVLGLVGFVFGAIKFSTNSLHRVIERQTAEVVHQKKEIEEKNKDITDSINYAKRIQQAILPTNEFARRLFPDSFILFRPKDIVSGDFFWLADKNGKSIVTAVDCTGHGVPGAFMSMIGNSLLNQIVKSQAITSPADILNELRDGVINSLKQTGKSGESKDGMDISLATFDFEAGTMEWAGAYNQLFLYRNGELIETKADKFPIGYGDMTKTFTNRHFDLQKGDTFYLFSDGYADQFGGEDGKKFMIKRFKKMFAEIQHLSMTDQKLHIEQELLQWMGDHEQVDDVLVIGIRV